MGSRCSTSKLQANAQSPPEEAAVRVYTHPKPLPQVTPPESSTDAVSATDAAGMVRTSRSLRAEGCSRSGSRLGWLFAAWVYQGVS